MTKVVEFESRATIERRAREWLIRLDGDTPLSDTEVRQLRGWIDSNPLHREELTRISTFWDRANVLTELAVPLAQERTREPARRERRWRVAQTSPGAVLICGLLASLILVVCLAWWNRHSDEAANRLYATAHGKQQTIALPDGSSVQLNTDSQVRVAYSRESRKIRLLRGEALFTVAHNTERPFEVYAGVGVVRAVGTAFSVQLQADSVDVTVAAGVVDVADLSRRPQSDISGQPNTDSRATEHALEQPLPSRVMGRLRAGQTGAFANGTRQLEVRDLVEPELQRRLSWRAGYLAFSGEPLSEMIREVNRYSPVRLEIADRQLAAIPVGGRFRVGDLDAVLDVLQTHFGIRSRQVDSHTIRLEAAPR